MAERKPTTRRTAAKKSTPARKPATKKAAAPQKTEAEELREKTIQTQRDKVATYDALKEQGLPIPADLKAEVESARETEPQEPVSPQRYVRNCYHSMFRFKLNRHAPGQRGIVLKPRGERGDLQPIEAEDLKDAVMIDNLNLGLIEIISHAEALDIVSKQTNNQQAVHPAMAALRNAKGEAYEDGAVGLGQSPDEQAITVAKLDNGQIAFDRTGIRDRVRGEAPGTPEYVSGAEPQHRPAGEDPAYLSDLRARQRGHNPAGELRVSVSEPVSTDPQPKKREGIISDGFNPDK